MEVIQQNPHNGFAILVADKNLDFRQIIIEDKTPTGAQIAAAAGFKPDQLATVIQLLASGAMEDIRPDEVVTLEIEPSRFIVAQTDRNYFFTVDGARKDWPYQHVTGHQIRKLAELADNFRLLLEREEEADLEIQNTDIINLDEPGIERFITRKAVWKLNVQGIVLTIDTPTIKVRDAVVLAGLNPNDNWHIYLKIEGQPKQEKTLEDVIDLTAPGIEKLRLTPKDVANGEAALPPRRLFNLLPVDELHLNRMGYRWETCLNAQDRRWLVIHDFQLPEGYTPRIARLALEVPPGYPNSQIDMFYFYPTVSLISGVEIPSVQVVATIDDVNFQGWSRHRTPTPWNPAIDNVITQLALVDGCLLKEIGE